MSHGIANRIRVIYTAVVHNLTHTYYCSIYSLPRIRGQRDDDATKVTLVVQPRVHINSTPHRLEAGRSVGALCSAPVREPMREHRGISSTAGFVRAERAAQKQTDTL